MDLALALIWRELVVRYKRSALGVLWALIEPFSAVIVYVLVFGVVLGADKSAQNYPFFTLLGVLPWLFVSSTLEQSSVTLLEHAPLARKIYFPWELLVVAVVTSRLSTLLLGIAAGVVLAACFGHDLAWARLAWLPLGLVELVLLIFGVSLVLSGVQPLLRDTAFIVRFILRIGFYACPIVYPLSLVPAAARPFYELNPLVAIMWTFQAFTDPALPPPSTASMLSGAVCSVVFCAGGAFLFRRVRDRVADLL